MFGNVAPVCTQSGDCWSSLLGIGIGTKKGPQKLINKYAIPKHVIADCLTLDGPSPKFVDEILAKR